MQKRNFYTTSVAGVVATTLLISPLPAYAYSIERTPEGAKITGEDFGFNSDITVTPDGISGSVTRRPGEGPVSLDNLNAGRTPHSDMKFGNSSKDVDKSSQAAGHWRVVAESSPERGTDIIPLLWRVKNVPGLVFAYPTPLGRTLSIEQDGKEIESTVTSSQNEKRPHGVTTRVPTYVEGGGDYIVRGSIKATDVETDTFIPLQVYVDETLARSPAASDAPSNVPSGTSSNTSAKPSITASSVSNVPSSTSATPSSTSSSTSTAPPSTSSQGQTASTASQVVQVAPVASQSPQGTPTSSQASSASSQTSSVSTQAPAPQAPQDNKPAHPTPIRLSENKYDASPILTLSESLWVDSEDKTSTYNPTMETAYILAHPKIVEGGGYIPVVHVNSTGTSDSDNTVGVLLKRADKKKDPKKMPTSSTKRSAKNVIVSILDDDDDTSPSSTAAKSTPATPKQTPSSSSAPSPVPSSPTPNPAAPVDYSPALVSPEANSIVSAPFEITPVVVNGVADTTSTTPTTSESSTKTKKKTENTAATTGATPTTRASSTDPKNTKSKSSKDPYDSETFTKLVEIAKKTDSLTVALAVPGEDVVVNGEDKPVYSASVIKLGVAAAAKKHELKGYDDDLAAMITRSDNEATNRIVLALGDGDAQRGFTRINDLVKEVLEGDDATFQMSNLMGKGGGYTSRITATGVAQVLGAIAQSSTDESQWIPREGAQEIIDLMKKQQVKTKLGSTMKVGSQLANKTGEHPQAGVTHDVGYMFSGDEMYVVAVTATFPEGNVSAMNTKNAEIARLGKQFSSVLGGGKGGEASSSSQGSSSSQSKKSSAKKTSKTKTKGSSSSSTSRSSSSSSSPTPKSSSSSSSQTSSTTAAPPPTSVKPDSQNKAEKDLNKKRSTEDESQWLISSQGLNSAYRPVENKPQNGDPVQFLRNVVDKIKEWLGFRF